MVFVIFEANSPHGSRYRLGLGWAMPTLASIVVAVTRLF
jgi:hypothetical protein